MEELTQTGKELLALLSERGFSKEDIFSVMLVLTKEEKALAFLAFLKDNENAPYEAVMEECARIAFGEGVPEKN